MKAAYRASAFLVLAIHGLAALAAGAPRSGHLAVAPGGVVRWSGAGTESCSVGGRIWAPLGDECWYPVDLEDKGKLRLVRTRNGLPESVLIEVGAYPYDVQRLKVADRMVNLSAADAERAEREAERIAALFEREGMPRFRLPLGAPLDRMPAGGSFGKRRFFNDEPRSPHSGADYSVPAGTPVRAAAPGTVVLAEEHFFGGKSVYLDHGGGLITIYLHLRRIDVAHGDAVERGEVLGVVGATGRVTGPHLHFGIRWHGKRVDPALLLGPVAAVPEVAPAPGEP